MTVILFSKSKKLETNLSIKTSFSSDNIFKIINGCYLRALTNYINSYFLETNEYVTNSLTSEDIYKYISSLSKVNFIDFKNKNKIGEEYVENIICLNSINNLNINVILINDISIDLKKLYILLSNNINCKPDIIFDLHIINILSKINSISLSNINSIDILEEKTSIFLNDINRTYEQNFKYIIDYGYIKSNNIVHVVLDGKDITHTIKEINIDLFDVSSILPSITIHYNGDYINKGQSVEIYINNNKLSFLAEEFEFNKKNKFGSIWGRSIFAKNHIPYVGVSEFKFNNLRASEILNNVLDNVNMIYEIDDWNIDNLYFSSVPFDICAKIVNSCGGCFTAFPDNNIYCFYPGNCPVISLEEKEIINYSIFEKENKYNSVQVKNKNDDILLIETDKNVVNIGEPVKVRVYSKEYKYNILSNVDNISLLNKRKHCIVTENLKIDNGIGIISKPIVKILSVEGCEQYEVVGQKIFSDSCSTITVEYETVFDEYELVNNQPGTKIVCCAMTDDIVCIFMEHYENSNQAGYCKEITTDFPVPQYILRKKAKQEILFLNKKRYRIETLYKDDFLYPNLRLQVDGKDMVVIKHSIKITNNPLKVKSVLETIEEII